MGVYGTDGMRLLATLVVLLQLTACDYGARRQLANLRQENHTLEAQLGLSSAYIEDVTELMDEVQQNLNAIEEREGIIGRISLQSGGSGESRVSRAVNVREELLTSISDIDGFIQENREKMDALRERIARSSVRIESLERLVDNLRVTVDEKERSVSQLKQQVRHLERNIASLQGELKQRDLALQQKDSTIAQQQAAIVERDETIQTQEELAATGYYVLDTRAALKRKGLITERRSGFLGLKKTTSVGTIQEEHFTDIPKARSTIRFDGSVKDIEIISAHRDRPELFRFDRSAAGSQLLINDPEGFWAISEYLVIVLDD
jgi:hypothetical protein